MVTGEETAAEGVIRDDNGRWFEGLLQIYADVLWLWRSCGWFILVLNYVGKTIGKRF